LAARDKLSRFEEAILPHLNAAYNLARWLMRSDADADDAVQDACLRALRFFGGFRGNDGRVWLLAIVRNTCYSKLKGDRTQQLETPFDEEAHGHGLEGPDPEGALLKSLDAAVLQRAVEALPEEFREVVVMRELEGLSYKEIADVTEVPIGTVMSRLARARARLQRSLKAEASERS
jgi:RNA polymerase sigma-70 factor (ECF subfamily)